MHRFIRKACFAHGNSSHFFPGTYWSQGLGEQQQQKSPLPPHLAGFIPTPHTQSTYNTVQNLFLSRRQLNPGGDVSLSTGMCLCPRARRGTHKGGGGCGDEVPHNFSLHTAVTERHACPASGAAATDTTQNLCLIVQPGPWELPKTCEKG